MSAGGFGPLFRYSATEGSLDLAEDIAKALGEEFNRKAVANLSEQVLEQTFSDLVGVLDLDPSDIEFQSGVYPKARVFIAQDSNQQTHIIMDMVFDFWVFAITHISTIVASCVLDADERKQIAEITEAVFSLLLESQNYKTVREKFLPLLLNYPTCLNLSGALSRSMSIFIMCHEIAHKHLGHLDTPQSLQIEIEADQLATQYFLKVVNAGRNQTAHTAYVDEKVAAAPLILMRMFDVYERWLQSSGIDVGKQSSHPKATDRIVVIGNIVLPHLNDKAEYILDGYNKSLDDLSDTFDIK